MSRSTSSERARVASDRTGDAAGRFDVVVLGAGVVGCAVARWLGRETCSTAVLEKGSDVGGGASSRNSGVIHSGVNYTPGTRRATLCMEGRALLEAWCGELNVPIRRCGKLIVAQRESERPMLQRLLEQGQANGVPGVQIVTGAQAATLQPGIRCVAALHVPSTSIVSPYAATIAMAEDAASNGVHFFLDHRITEIEPDEEGFAVWTERGSFHARAIVNCAGIYASELARCLTPDAPPQYPCAGEYLLLDKQAGESLRMAVYPAPHAGGAGLGVHITPTTEGNVLLGPSNEYVEEVETDGTTQVVADTLLGEAKAMWPDVPERWVIGSYAGIRPKLTPPEIGGFSDYILLRTEAHPRALHLLGIESPGLTAAPALARLVVEDFLRPLLGFAPKPSADVRVRRWPTRFDELPEREKEHAVAENPDHGEIVCRCEGVTRAEVLHALDNPLRVRTLAGIKFRSRAMMGRCSGGYCLPRIVAMLQDEYGVRPEAIQLRGPSSPAFVGPLLEEGDPDARNA
ncbi:MAG: NAD(P)/FAD-dependent oxidoreductase [Candidatus Bipolaricaulota bacterium]